MDIGLQRRRVHAGPPFLCSRRALQDPQIPPRPSRTGKHYGKQLRYSVWGSLPDLRHCPSCGRPPRPADNGLRLNTWSRGVKPDLAH
jgi:hypothetical protein